MHQPSGFAGYIHINNQFFTKARSSRFCGFVSGIKRRAVLIVAQRSGNLYRIISPRELDVGF